MKVLVTGGNGQIARAVQRGGRGRGHDVTLTPRAQLDITKRMQIINHLEDLRPAVVINCAAYTAVDAAESRSEEAFAVNAVGAKHVADACAALGIPVIHVSTDYVFNGRSRRPYREDDPVDPVSVYGASKAVGEDAVIAAGGIVVRTSWVFSRDCASFVRTIARAALTQPTLGVVDDQTGCPTYADDIAGGLLAIADRTVHGTMPDRLYHACDEGPITWCGFAHAIVAEVRKHCAIPCAAVTAIATAAYPTAARRPAYSVLDTSRLRALGIVLPSWEAGLAISVRELLA